MKYLTHLAYKFACRGVEIFLVECTVNAMLYRYLASARHSKVNQSNQPHPTHIIYRTMILLEVRPFFVYVSRAHTQPKASQLYHTNDFGGQICKVCNYPYLSNPEILHYHLGPPPSMSNS